MSVHRTFYPQEYPCLFCGEKLPDWFHSWYAHVEEKRGCFEAWQLWIGNVKREAGGT